MLWPFYSFLSLHQGIYCNIEVGLPERGSLSSLPRPGWEMICFPTRGPHHMKLLMPWATKEIECPKYISWCSNFKSLKKIKKLILAAYIGPLLLKFTIQ